MRKFTTRRNLLLGASALAAGGAALAWRHWPLSGSPGGDFDQSIIRGRVGMPYRKFGRTDLQVSEVGFGSWGTGGAYGAVDRAESLRALARAQEFGCNFIDTAMGYGDAELVIGEFLRGRRHQWIVATKYSGQPEGLIATVDKQLERLGTDHIDFYQIHWVPKDKDRWLYDELEKVKQSGKVRFIGVSLNNISDIDYVLRQTRLDGLQLPFSLLDPVPFLARAKRLRDSGLGIIARSALKDGFLTGKYARDAKFADPGDRRGKLTRAEVATVVENVEAMRFLEAEQGSLLLAAARYPLSFSEISTCILGTKNEKQAMSNFGEVPGKRLPRETLERVAKLQDDLGLWGLRARLDRGLRRWFG